MQDFVPRLRGRVTPTLLYSFDRAGVLAPHGSLALCVPQYGGWRITVFQLEPLVRSLHVSLPDYMGAWLNVEGERWNVGNG